MSITYTKRKNTSLFASLEKHGYAKLQNYIPTYKHFFVLNHTNYNSINLTGQWFLKKIHAYDEESHTYSAVVENTQNGKTKNVDLFIKNAPLLDPVKYMVGVHHHELDQLTNLPRVTEGPAAAAATGAPVVGGVIPKVNDPSNASYVDNLFNVVNSQLLEKGFVHGIEWYGSFLGIKQDFECNIYDDLDYLFHSKYFLKHVGSLFHVPKEILDEVQKPSLKIDEEAVVPSALDDIEDITGLDPVSAVSAMSAPSVEVSLGSLSLLEAEPVTDLVDADLLLVDDEARKSEKDGEGADGDAEGEEEEDAFSNSSYSSRTSYTNEYTDMLSASQDRRMLGGGGGLADDYEEDEGCPELVESYHGGEGAAGAGRRLEKEENVVSDGSDDDEDENGDEKGEDGSMGSDYDDEEYIPATIPAFPVQLICIEACEATLDELMLNNELNEHELFSCMMQIIMILATYQKLYQFTHNDLHSNNVMFVETNKKYLQYEYQGKKYLVPTYGKIYKIIDFGRSIFTIQNQVFCGDCYQRHGDAYSQYNFGPCLNETKPLVPPNYSFDLCRLACNMFDHLITHMSELENVSALSPFKQLVVRLCTDDRGLNVLYKRTHEERYPCFKLYKMISRTVHNHTPDRLLETPDFAKYLHDGASLPAGVSKKEVCYVNIDSY